MSRSGAQVAADVLKEGVGELGVGFVEEIVREGDVFVEDDGVREFRGGR